MSATAPLAAPAPDAPAGGSAAPAVSGLASGVALLLALSLVQRVIGLARNILFCRLLDEHELGVWSLAFSFLLLAAPLAALGLPGTFGRFVERYRTRGELRGFLARSVAGCLALAAAWATAFWFAAPALAWLVFDDPAEAPLVRTIGVALPLVVAANALTELLTALRQARVTAWAQFAQGIVFSLAGLGLLAAGTGVRGAALAYAASCAAAAGIALPALWRAWRGSPAGGAPPAADLWRRLLPYAVWMWVINLLANLFDAADRYLIVHFGAADPHAAQALVGQYHSAGVLPGLLTSAAALGAGVVLPYLSADWEARRSHAVAARVNLTLKTAALGLSGAAAVLLAGAPFLFQTLLGGKYADGLAVLPWTLACACWFGLATLAQTYLWCGEQGRWASAALAAGLAVNVGLNLLLLPPLGLLGAVLATAAGNVVVLGLVLLFNRRNGLPLDPRAALACLAPLALPLGPLGAVAAWSVLAAAAWFTPLVFTAEEKAALGAAIPARLRWGRLPNARPTDPLHAAAGP